MLPQTVEQRLRRRQRVAEAMLGGVLPFARDAFEQIGLGLLAKPVQFGDLAGLAGGFKFGDGIHAELLVERLDLLRPEAGNVEHLDEARRDGGFQLLVIFQFPRLDEFGDLLFERFADAFDFAEPLFGDELGERLAQAFERPRGVGVGAGLERVFALQFQQRADFDEHLGDFVFVHGSIMPQHFRFSQYFEALVFPALAPVGRASSRAGSSGASPHRAGIFPFRKRHCVSTPATYSVPMQIELCYSITATRPAPCRPNE